MSIAAPAPRVLADTIRTPWVRDIAMVIAATAFIALSAQVAIPLPFSPVPLTGQTLAVLLSCAALGARRSMLSTALYLVAAVAGLPVLAPTADGSHITGLHVFSMASLGYVLGFIAAGAVVGTLAERGFTRTPLRVITAMLAGNAVIYVLGTAVLAAVTHGTFAQVIAWGVTPFLIGDALKIAIAAGLLPGAWSLVSKLSH